MKQELKLAGCFICSLIALYLYMRPNHIGSTQSNVESAGQRSISVDSRTPSPTPVVETRPQPTPVPREGPSVKQTNENEWRVYLVDKTNWFDTGIPIIANGLIRVTRATDSEDIKWLTKVGETGPVMFAPEGGGGGGRWIVGKYFCEPETDPDFRGTVRLKIDDESKLDTFKVTVVTALHVCDPIYNSDERKKYHVAAEKWYAMMRARIDRQ